MRISTQVAEEPLFQFCISKWRCFLRFCHVFAPAWFYVQKTFFTQCRITDSFEILNRAAASRVVSSSLRDFRTTVSRNSGVWRSFFHVIRSISWSYQSLTLPSRCFFNTKTFSDTTWGAYRRRAQHQQGDHHQRQPLAEAQAADHGATSCDIGANL